MTSELKEKQLVYLCNGFDSVFDSQVIELLLSIKKRQVFGNIILLFGIRNTSQKKLLERRTSLTGMEVKYFKSYPNYPGFNIIFRKSLYEALKKNDLLTEQSVFHTRGETLAWHLSRVCGDELIHNILPDVRGAGVEEIKEFQKSFFILKLLKVYNKRNAARSLRKFDVISAVSESLKKYLVTNYNIEPAKLVVTPCSAGIQFQVNSRERLKIRNKLNIRDDENLIVFVRGNEGIYQNAGIAELIGKKGFRVLNISRQKILNENVINEFLDYCEVPSRLNAADIAILWRDNSIVNEVSSPVKFSEFVCCGLPVISNYSINVVTDFIEKTNAGLVLNSLEEIDLEKMKFLRTLNRQVISSWGSKMFGIENITNSYLRIYFSLIR